MTLLIITQAGCERELGELSRRFANLMNVSVIESKCNAPMSIPSDEGTIQLRPMHLIYQAEQEVKLHAAVFGLNGCQEATGDHFGAFDRFSSCLAALPILSQRDFEQTGSTVVDGYCMSAKSQFSSSRQKVYLRLNGTPQRGVTPSKTLFIQGVSFSVQNPEVLIRISDRACERQQQRVQIALNRWNPTARPSFSCFARFKGGSQTQFGLGIWSSRRHVDLSILPVENYTSLEDCLGDLDRLDRKAPRDPSQFREMIGYIIEFFESEHAVANMAALIHDLYTQELTNPFIDRVEFVEF